MNSKDYIDVSLCYSLHQTEVQTKTYEMRKCNLSLSLRLDIHTTSKN